ncbi:MAG: hypothetical protein ACM3X9_12665 [Bacillota bacterium]
MPRQLKCLNSNRLVLTPAGFFIAAKVAFKTKSLFKKEFIAK